MSRRQTSASAVARPMPPPPPAPAAPDLGWCPVCGEPGETRSARQYGTDTCRLGHIYPSVDAVRCPPEGQA